MSPKRPHDGGEKRAVGDELCRDAIRVVRRPLAGALANVDQTARKQCVDDGCRRAHVFFRCLQSDRVSDNACVLCVAPSVCRDTGKKFLFPQHIRLAASHPTRRAPRRARERNALGAEKNAFN